MKLDDYDILYLLGFRKRRAIIKIPKIYYWRVRWNTCSVSFRRQSSRAHIAKTILIIASSCPLKTITAYFQLLTFYSTKTTGPVSAIILLCRTPRHSINLSAIPRRDLRVTIIHCFAAILIKTTVNVSDAATLALKNPLLLIKIIDRIAIIFLRPPSPVIRSHLLLLVIIILILFLVL